MIDPRLHTILCAGVVSSVRSSAGRANGTVSVMADKQDLPEGWREPPPPRVQTKVAKVKAAKVAKVTGPVRESPHAGR
jgi:hypothetical protein